MQFDSFNYSVLDVAKFFIIKNRSLTPLKLHKLIYYAQATSLAFYDKTLFKEELEAWTHGPICQALYDHFSDGIPSLKEEEKMRILNLFSDAPVFQILDDVLEHFGNCSGIELENKTRAEKPWTDAIKLGKNTIITPASMHAYFKPLIHEVQE